MGANGAASLIFIAGAEGSGTTLLSRILSAPAQCASLGGLHVKLPNGPDADELAKTVRDANTRASDRALGFDEHRKAVADWRNAFERTSLSPTFSSTSVFVFKRSFPFASQRSDAEPLARRTPDLWDCLSIWPATKIVAIYRDPCAATYSSFRRGFDTDLRRLAVTCAEQLTWLSAQIAAIGASRCRVVSYRELCENHAQVLIPLAQFCGLPADELIAAAQAERVSADGDRRYREKLDHAETAWLESYFDTRRSQWAVLGGMNG